MLGLNFTKGSVAHSLLHKQSSCFVHTDKIESCTRDSLQYMLIARGRINARQIEVQGVLEPLLPIDGTTERFACSFASFAAIGAFHIAMPRRWEGILERRYPQGRFDRTLALPNKSS
jgi:hypothetical protein